MPIITILIETPSDPAGLLSSVSDAVAIALGLADGQVIATLVPAGPTVVSGSSALASPWPIVTIHGADRGNAKMEAALSAAEVSVRSWLSGHDIEFEGVWVQWLTPTPAPA